MVVYEGGEDKEKKGRRQIKGVKRSTDQRRGEKSSGK